MAKKKKSFTKKEKAFIEAYVNDIKQNRTAAAIAAGYSEKSAKQTAYRLMQKPEIREAIDEILEERHKQNTAKADEVIEFLTSVMRGEEVDNIPLLTVLGSQELTEGKPSARDRVRAAEMLGKYYALFTDRTQLDSKGVVQIINDIPRSDTDAKAD